MSAGSVGARATAVRLPVGAGAGAYPLVGLDQRAVLAELGATLGGDVVGGYDAAPHRGAAGGDQTVAAEPAEATREGVVLDAVVDAVAELSGQRAIAQWLLL